MKTIIRFFSMLALVGGIAVTGALAQDVCSDLDTPTAQYEKFLSLYNKKPPVEAEVQDAINTGKAFLEKFGACEAWKEQVAFVRPQTARLEKVLIGLGDAKLYKRFDDAIVADNTAEIYTVGKEIMAKYPDNVNVQYVLSVAATREAVKKNNAYNAEALRYANSLLQAMKGGTAKLTKKTKDGKESIGALKYEYPKEDAMSELAYTIAYLNYYGQNDKKNGIQYYYQVAQTPGFRKNYAPVYATIGDFYISEAAPIGAEIAKLIEQQKAATTDDEKLKLDEQIKAKVALFNGYTERALDAFGRAWNVAKDTTPEEKKYKEGLLATVKDLYKRRFDKETGVNEWVAASIAKPLPDPTSAVQPVSDPEPAKTTTTTTGAGTGVAASTGTGAANPNATAAGNTAAAKPAAAKPAGAKTATVAKPKR